MTAGADAAPRGQLRVDVPSPFATMILIPALPQFHARFPDIAFELGASDRKVDLIGENVDCVVRGGEMTDGALVARRIGALRLGVLWLPDYMARPHAAQGGLVPLVQDWCVDPLPLYIAYPPQRHVSKSCACLSIGCWS